MKVLDLEGEPCHDEVLPNMLCYLNTASMIH